MLLELAFGDTYGAGFEYGAKEFVPQFNTLEQLLNSCYPVKNGHPKELLPDMYRYFTGMNGRNIIPKCTNY
jgi:hypothetical protein